MHTAATRARGRLPGIARIVFLSALIGLSPAPADAAAPRDGGLGLCVGINNYAHFMPLSASGASSEAVAGALMATGGFRRVFELMDAEAGSAADPEPRRRESGSGRIVPGRPGLATRAAILGAIRLISNNATRDDALVFFFRGHGLSDGGKFYIMPLDAEPREAIDPDAGIPLDDIVAIMRKSRAESKLLLVDANSDAEIPDGVNAAIDPGADDFTVIVSCSEGERSISDPKRGMGLFAMALEAALSGRADADRDGALTGGELQAFLEAYMGGYCLDNAGTLSGVGQTPQMRTGDPGVAVLHGPSFDEIEPEAAPGTDALAETPAEEDETPVTAAGGDGAPGEEPGEGAGADAAETASASSGEAEESEKPPEPAAPGVDEAELRSRLAAAERLQFETKHDLAFAAFMELTGYGMPEAEFQVGNAYYYGKGVEQSYRKAEEWFIRAGDLGHERAQKTLSVMYWTGTGIPADYAKAVKWDGLRGKIPEDAKPVVDKRPGGGVLAVKAGDEPEQGGERPAVEPPVARPTQPVRQSAPYQQGQQQYRYSQQQQYPQQRQQQYPQQYQRNDPNSFGMRARRYLLGF